MTRETKFGLLLVLSLTTTFGFIVWKKMHQPKALVATTEETTEEGDATGDNDDGDSTPAGLLLAQNEPKSAPPLVEISTERAAPKRPVTRNENAPRSEALFAEDVPVSTPVARPKPKLPTNLDGEDFFSAPKNAARITPNPAPPTVPATEETDPFAAPTSAPVAVNEEPDPFANPPQDSATAQKVETEPEPLNGTEPIDSVPVRSVPADTFGSTTTEPDPFSNEPVTVRQQEPVLETESNPLADTAAVEARETIVIPNTVQNVESVEVKNEPDPFAAPVDNAPVEVSARSTVPAVKAEIATEPEPVLAFPERTEPVAPAKTVAAMEPDPFFVDTDIPTRTAPPARTTSAPRMAAPVVEPDPFSTPAAIPEIPARTESTFPARRTSPVPTTAIPEVPVRAEPLPYRAESIPVRQPARVNAPVAFAGETYIVQPNDNFWIISKKVYGTGRYFEALAHYNAGLVSDPSKMKPGLKIATPTEAELQARYSRLLAATGTQVVTNDPVSLGLPGDIYTAVDGDNFWEISKRLYGDGKYFRALEQHNLAIVSDPQKLRPGMKLAAPKAAWLQAKYPQLIAHVAPAVQELKRVQPARYQPDEPAGFFIGPGDQPMYRVGTRDTLTDIAKNYLGRSSRWVQIHQMNRDVLTDGNSLSVGTVLRLPADASRVAVIESGAQFR